MAELITPGGSDTPDKAEPRLIVDSDWKAEAQAEKEKLAQQEATSKPRKGHDDLPEPDFRTVVSMLATQALMYLGAFPDEQGRAVVVPEYAKMHIDLLAVLKDKTRGNLTAEEDEELDQILIELRQRFVQILGVAQAQQAQQAQQPATPQD
ncbi:MAG: DUF1844 domain-containing protein [Phycisphaeraceae bacterium]|nr:DUF1844 domain-containing protein [Phycisphaeraceae bacterium]MCB9848103.1 DUF1844 domain-containing protein [Phycisphaeraceae bacterium]